jgi:hypothetical protein
MRGPLVEHLEIYEVASWLDSSAALLQSQLGNLMIDPLGPDCFAISNYDYRGCFQHSQVFLLV